MRVLSIRQPWAQMIMQGYNDIEVRTWKTRFRGKFLIHVPEIPDKRSCERFEMDWRFLDRGKIIGEAKLFDVKKYENVDEFMEDQDRHHAGHLYAKDAFPVYGFILDDTMRVKGRKINGGPGFFEVSRRHALK